jgi:hypothetical protein
MTKQRIVLVFPPNVPKRLVKAYMDSGCVGRELARRLGVNDFYISQALRGIEPRSPAVRAKMFYPKRIRKSEPRPPLPELERRAKRCIRSMVKKTRRALQWNKDL